jgi:hypothetical protein
LHESVFSGLSRVEERRQKETHVASQRADRRGDTHAVSTKKISLVKFAIGIVSRRLVTHSTGLTVDFISRSHMLTAATIVTGGVHRGKRLKKHAPHGRHAHGPRQGQNYGHQTDQYRRNRFLLYDPQERNQDTRKGGLSQVRSSDATKSHFQGRKNKVKRRKLSSSQREKYGSIR